MNANLAPDKYLIVYYSASGNTKAVSDLIVNNLNNEEKVFDMLSLQSETAFEQIDIEEYNHVFLGSPTYGNGETPKPILDFLRHIIKYNNFNLPSFSVFGTGDTQWSTYCKSVDELEYHLTKKTKVISKLKIEQYPISDYQVNKINEFVQESLRR